MKVFVSYTRSKDAFSAVTQFCEHLASELSISAPGSTVLQDKTFISPGDPFPEKITQALNDADVLLVLVSPAWLASSWCRREFELFSANKTALNQRPCILPVLWVNTPAIQRNSSDPIARKLADLEYQDWRNLRHEAWDNPELLAQIARLAETSVDKVPEQERIQAEGGTGS